MSTGWLWGLESLPSGPIDRYQDGMMGGDHGGRDVIFCPLSWAVAGLVKAEVTKHIYRVIAGYVDQNCVDGAR